MYLVCCKLQQAPRHPPLPTHTALPIDSTAGYFFGTTLALGLDPPMLSRSRGSGGGSSESSSTLRDWAKKMYASRWEMFAIVYTLPV
jgi:hypothetical protein